jgi:hypothetical protein
MSKLSKTLQPSCVSVGLDRLSNMATDHDVLSQLDAVLQNAEPHTNPWVGDEFFPDLDLARRLLEIPIKAGGAEKQQSGRLAKSLDAWIAHELRRAGFPKGSVWPRMERPRILPADLDPADLAITAAEDRLWEFEQVLAKYQQQAQAAGLKRKAPSTRRLGPALRRIREDLPGKSHASILGRFYVKQVDVVVSSWERGPDVLVSGKTQLSSYLKNKNNRYEEAVGEGKNLRDRYPLASMGFAYLVRSNIGKEQGAFSYLRNQLARLRKPDGFFDATMLLVLDWDDDEKVLGPLDDPTDNLTAPRFFADLVNAVLDYTPVGVHQAIREMKEGEPDGGAPPPDEGVSPEEAAAHDAD